jgi:hypothetical protein
MSEVQISPVALERHLSVSEVASQWNVSRDTVRRVFQDLPGVLKIGHSETKHKRKYVTLRIPERIVKAEHASLTKGVSS